MHSVIISFLPAFASLVIAAPSHLRLRGLNSTSSFASNQVTNSVALSNGAGNTNNANVNDGGATSDVYNCFLGEASNFPPSSEWASFDSLWNEALPVILQSCENNPSTGPGDSLDQANDILTAIQQVAEASLVDHRFILSIVMQESRGCVNVITTPNPDGISNPGLMQTDGGSSFIGNSASASDQASSITQMIIDGTQGTLDGNGLVQCINLEQDVFSAARCYNSGTAAVDPNDLNSGGVGTSSYVMDVANRLTGWLLAPSRFGECISGS